MSDVIKISSDLTLDINEIVFKTTRASGPGGQHVNKTNSAVQLSFDVMASSLPALVKARIINYKDSHLTQSGEIQIRCEESRSQFRNRKIAIQRLKSIISGALKPVKVRRKTRPSYGSVKRRLKAKAHRSDIKRNRGKVTDFD